SFLVYKFVDGNVSFDPNIDLTTFNHIRGEPKGIQVFDVREPHEIQTEGKFPGATNIPFGDVESAFALNDTEFEAKYGVMKPKIKDDNIVFVSKAGKEGLTACECVRKCGYKRYKCMRFERDF
uniref:Rhodanese domain-containing protein n=1 Tax=Mesocestoides corti TaxID=53468 RepID=A0A5K3FWX4_MESCO